MSIRDEPLAFEMAERGALIVPNALVARGQPIFFEEGVLPAVLAPERSGLGFSSVLRPGQEPWLAVHAGVGPTRLLVCWAAPRAPAGAASCPPASYRIESAAGSSRAVEGDYRLELRVTGNASLARAHVIDFDAQSWVRITFEGSTGDLVSIDRLAVHDASDGTDDVWLVLGDDLAREALVPADDAGFADLVYERYPGYFPAMIDETHRGERPPATLARLPKLLAVHPHARHVALAYGVARDAGASAEEEAALAELVAELTRCDRSVSVALAPLRGGILDPNSPVHRALAECGARRLLLPGPDLGGWFRAHPEHLAEDGTPTREGRRAMRHLWVEALDVLYVPQ
jgi:hypothetical protein